jgi:hypothetical protein
MKFLVVLLVFTIAIICAHAKPIEEQEGQEGHDQEQEHESHGVDAEEGEYFQGDIILTEDQRKYLFDEESEDDESDSALVSNRTGVKDLRFRWPKDSKGQVIVPYTFDPKAKFCEFH